MKKNIYNRINNVTIKSRKKLSIKYINSLLLKFELLEIFICNLKYKKTSINIVKKQINYFSSVSFSLLTLIENEHEPLMQLKKIQINEKTVNM